MALALRLESILFSGADRPVATADSDLIVLVGPNNAGKSQALRDIDDLLLTSEAGPVVKAAPLRKEGDVSAFRTWLSEAGAEMPRAPGENDIRVAGKDVTVFLGSAQSWWQSGPPFHGVGRFLIFRGDAETRLQLAGNVPSVDAVEGHATEPLQRLLVDHRLETRLSDAVQRAFDTPVCVNRTGGSMLHLHLGRPVSEARLDNQAYLEELRTLPLVSAQGDGMRSFIGLLLALTATDYPLVLVDEPEAFLHPPQAREMGRQLARASGQQRVVATHDSDVLLGILDSTESVAIVRLRREGNQNIPSVLDAERLKGLWRDPFLRYSKLLDGLFHRGVVICESDGDATLYAAALDHRLQAGGQAASDLLFTQCGGKHKLPAAIDALRPMGVPTAAIADIDVLRDEDLLRRIVESLGGNWTEFRRDWNVVTQAVDQLPAANAVIADVTQQIERVLGDDPTARLTEQQTRAIRSITRSSDGWRQVRSMGGISAVPNGDATEAVERLVAELASLGLFVVQVGALEGWAPAIGKHGPEFVFSALETRVHESNAELDAFIAAVSDHLRRPS
jgi:hypothetical protein